jgi:hypothetical protein
MKRSERNDQQIGERLYRDILAALDYSRRGFSTGTDPDFLVREVFRDWHGTRPQDFSRIMQQYLYHLNRERLAHTDWMCSPLPRVWQARRLWPRRELLPFDRITIGWDQWILAAQLMMSEILSTYTRQLYYSRRDAFNERTRSNHR